MNRPRTLLLVIVGLTLACGVLLLFWPKQSNQVLRLKIVRRAVEQGKPVVFFRVHGPPHRWLSVQHVFKVVGDRVEDMQVKDSEGDTIRTPGFWAPSQEADPPIGYGGAEEREVGVTAPAKVLVWKLHVELGVEDRYARGRFRRLIRDCISALTHGRSLTGTAHDSWNNTIPFHIESVESDPITNPVTPEAFSNAME